MNEPELRFKTDDGGEFPEWKHATLGELGTFSKGAPLSKADVTETGTPMILYGELYTTYGEITYEIQRHTNANVDEKYYSHAGDVIIPTSGETPEEISTATCVMIDGVVLAGDLNIYRTKKDVDGRLMSYILNHQINEDIARIAQGKSIVHIQAKELDKLFVFYPCIEEQQKIADLFSTLDNVINSVQKEVDSWEQMKRGVMQKLFSQEVRFKADDGSEFPEWKEKKVQDVCTVTNGKSNTQDKNDDGLYPFFIRSEHIEHSDTYLFDKEAVITIGDGNIGDVFHYYKGKFNLHQRCYAMFDFKNVNGRFFYYYFSYFFKRRVQRLNAQATVSSVRKNFITDMEIKVPCTEEQLKIADCLSEFDAVIEKTKQKLEAYKQLKKGLMQRMFV